VSSCAVGRDKKHCFFLELYPTTQKDHRNDYFSLIIITIDGKERKRVSYLIDVCCAETLLFRQWVFLILLPTQGT
jgi:hypothetical protein